MVCFKSIALFGLLSASPVFSSTTPAHGHAIQPREADPDPKTNLVDSSFKTVTSGVNHGLRRLGVPKDEQPDLETFITAVIERVGELVPNKLVKNIRKTSEGLQKLAVDIYHDNKIRGLVRQFVCPKPENLPEDPILERWQCTDDQGPEIDDCFFALVKFWRWTAREDGIVTIPANRCLGGHSDTCLATVCAKQETVVDVRKLTAEVWFPLANMCGVNGKAGRWTEDVEYENLVVSLQRTPRT